MILTVRGLPSLNEYINAERSNRYAAAKIKKSATALVAASALEQLPQIDGKCEFFFTWYERNKRRDPDNVAFAKKFIFDGIVQAGKMPNDGWGQVEGFMDRFKVDKRGPYVEVIIRPLK